MTQISYPSGRTVDKYYDETNFLATVDYLGNQAAAFTPDENGRIIFAGYGNDTDLTLTYDTIGREESRTFATPGSDPLFTVSDMTYDGRGSLTAQTETFDAVTAVDAFTYDNQDRLTARTRNLTPAGEWDYDLVGNWEYTNQNGTAETRTVTGDNEYTNVGGLLPVHDGRGNMTFDGDLDYEYDWANRLIRVASGATVLGEYTYDALNRRVTKAVNTVSTTFVYDDDAVVEAYENTVLRRTYVYGNAVDDPILVETGSQVYYYIADIRGSIRAVTDSSGALKEYYEYGPFGLMAIFDNQGQDITTTGSTIGNPYGIPAGGEIASPGSGITGTGCTLLNWGGSCSVILPGMWMG
ncbi:RHS repeat protein [Desulfobacter hydrogenophilus]|uniref:RHS repeat protein n=1 Tax=Desulfobacter hydrogenophilus TaxID=2291 RepID=A0ABX5RAW1_9BACT|nr:RHS repeat protein [Desulfobacter hydrogenophilus]NDY71865.1 RHS repeat protein [Desulfobacter hydrogenophilus]QBH12000.1 RHS repeat protein [Desulfobacter hydrogenophilus]